MQIESYFGQCLSAWIVSIRSRITASIPEQRAKLLIYVRGKEAIIAKLQRLGHFGERGKQVGEEPEDLVRFHCDVAETDGTHVASRMQIVQREVVHLQRESQLWQMGREWEGGRRQW